MLSNAIDAYVPWHPPRATGRKASSIKASTKRLIAEKHKLWRLYIDSPNSINYSLYKTTRNRCSSQIRCDRKQEQLRLATRFSHNPRSLFSYYSSISKSRGGVSSLRVGDTHTGSNTEAALALRDFYSSVFQLPIPQPLPPYKSSSADIHYTFLSPSAVVHKLLALGRYKSPGLEGIPPSLLKSCCHSLAPFFSELFRDSIERRQIPSD